MKHNTIHNGGKRKRLIGLLVIGAVFLVGLAFGFSKLRAIWLEQSVIRDMARQVEITPGRMVKADILADCLGLRAGANLQTIDFAERRRKTLLRIPNLKELSVRLSLPDRVRVSIVEREPVARLSVRKRKTDTGKVVDAEGVVFACTRGTRLLPVIREAAAPGTPIGQRLGGRAQAALQLLAACHEPAFQELSIMDVDVSNLDWLQATINTGSNYSQLKIAWEGMDEPETPASHANLLRQLTHLRDAIRSRVGDSAVIWNATDTSTPGRIFADTKGRL